MNLGLDLCSNGIEFGSVSYGLKGISIYVTTNRKKWYKKYYDIL